MLKQMKVVLTGPECTGKTTLARALSEHMKVPLVREYAREYLTNLKRPYQEPDLLKIAQGQLESEQRAASRNRLFICDTDLTVIKIWSIYKYGQCHPSIEKWHRQSYGQLYFIPFHDIPYEEDVLRENPNDRDALYDMYVTELNRMQVPYLILRGPLQRRLKNIIGATTRVADKQLM